jgi:hypothetical protein
MNIKFYSLLANFILNILLSELFDVGNKSQKLLNNLELFWKSWNSSFTFVIDNCMSSWINFQTVCWLYWTTKILLFLAFQFVWVWLLCHISMAISMNDVSRQKLKTFFLHFFNWSYHFTQSIKNFGDLPDK